MCSGQSCSGPLNLVIAGSSSGNPITIENIESHVYCTNSDEGSILLSITGGEFPYDCMWNTGDTTEALHYLFPGTYTVTVTDATNCSASSSINILQQHPINQNLYLVDYEACGSCHIVDNEETFIYSNVDYMMYIKDLNDGVSIGEIETCVDIGNSESEFGNEFLLRRSWKVKASNARAKVRLFFEKDELKTLSDAAGYDKFSPSTIENSVSVYQFIGGEHNKDDYESLVKFEDLKFYKFGHFENIWYVEIDPNRFDNDHFVGFELALEKKLDFTPDPVHQFGTDSISIFLVKNPVDQYVEIGSDGDTEGYGEIIIYDRVGNIKHVERFKGESILGRKAFVGNYRPGFYMCVIRYYDRKLSKAIKFIKI